MLYIVNMLNLNKEVMALHELEYEFRNRIQQALAASPNGWTAQEQCNAIIDQAKYTEPMPDLAVDTRPPPPPPAAAPAPPQGNTGGKRSKPTRTLLLLGIVLILVVAALVIVGTLPADTYEEE